MNSQLASLTDIAYSFKETLYNTYEMTKSIIDKVKENPSLRENLVFVECGVAAGAQIGAMNIALDEMDMSNPIYAFDSFEGIPLAGVNDADQPGIGAITHDPSAPISERLVSSGVTCHSLSQVVYNLTHRGISIENIRMIKGWFQESLPLYAKEIDKIGLLRLDGDLYESTLVCMEYLYPKVIEGGIVIIDDYALPGCRKAVHDYFEKRDMPVPNMVPVAPGGVVWFVKEPITIRVDIKSIHPIVETRQKYDENAHRDWIAEIIKKSITVEHFKACQKLVEHHFTMYKNPDIHLQLTSIINETAADKLQEHAFLLYEE